MDEIISMTSRTSTRTIPCTLFLLAFSFHGLSAIDSTHQRNTDTDGSSPAVRWIPNSSHPCTIRKVTVDELVAEFGKDGLPPLYSEPIILVSGGKRNAQFRQMTNQETILESFPANFTVTLSSSNSFSEHRRITTLKQYIREQVTTETLPSILSNETWYLFGETYSSEWQELLRHYVLPPCLACRKESVALSFGIGNRGSGVQWHLHGPGFSESLHGRKHWVIYKEKPKFHPDKTSRNWMEHDYTEMAQSSRPLECTLEPGELVYFPDMFWHATINLDPYTAFVSTFTQEHFFEKLEL